MTDRFDTLTDVAQQPYDTFDGAQTASAAIDYLIAHIRAAHDAGTTIGELHAQLAPLLSGAPPSKPSSTPNAVPFPLPLQPPMRHRRESDPFPDFQRASDRDAG